VSGKGRWLAALLFLWGGIIPARPVPWSYRADFHHGFTGWMSYPLPQDIGFDPTLSVEPLAGEPVLIREVVSVGERSLSVGCVRPLHFLANASTKLQLRYAAVWPSASASLKLRLAGVNGVLYETSLPAAGSHEITVTGAELHLPSTAVEIEAIVLMGASQQPAAGARNRVELRAVQVLAERPAELPLVRPALLADTDQARVAAEVVDPSTGLTIELAAGPFPIQLVLKDGQGRTAVERTLATPRRQSISLGPGARPGLWSAHLQTTSAHSDFSFLVLGPIGAHPRVLLSAERLIQLRTAAEFSTMRKQIHEQAATQRAKLKDAVAAGAEIANLPAGKSLRPSFDGELTSYFQLVEGYSNSIASSALDYALNGDSASLTAARRDLLAVSRWPTWTPSRFAAHGMHTYYETGIIAQRLALAYDLLAGNLSTVEKDEVGAAFRTKCIEPTLDEYFRYNRMPTGASNWMSNSLGGALAAAVAIAADSHDGVQIAQLLSAYQQNLHGLFPGDGGEMEPAGYEHFAMQGISWGAAALQNLNIQPAGTTDMFDAFWLPQYAMVQPSLVLDTGDFNGEFRSLSGFAFGAEFSGIQALRTFYERAAKKMPLDPLDLLCCTKAAAQQAEIPIARIFNQRGTAILRSSWRPDATVISLRAGPWFNHEHHDQGSFQVAAFGARVISEAGYASYYLDPNYAGYFTQAPGHNTVLVDDDAFSQQAYDGVFWSALRKRAAFTAQFLSPRFDYISASLAPAYGEHLSGYEREYLYLAPDVLIVRDNLRSAHPHVFTWQLHAAEGAAVEQQGSRAHISVSGVNADVLAANPVASWDVRSTPLPSSSTQYLGNVLLNLKKENDTRRRSVLRLSSPRSTAAKFEVAIQFHKTLPANSSLQTVDLSNASGFQSADAAGPWALFRNAPGTIQFHDLASDGSVFAGRGSADWLTVAARSVSLAGRRVFTADAASSAAWHRSSTGIELDLQLSAPTVITIDAAQQVTSVSVDGAPVRFQQQNGKLKLPSLKEGVHRVQIFTRAAL
jgi:hypothetical protein